MLNAQADNTARIILGIITSFLIKKKKAYEEKANEKTPSII